MHDVRTALVRLVTPFLVVLFASAAFAQPAEKTKFRPAPGGIDRDYLVVLHEVPPAKVAEVAGALGREHGATVTEVWRLALRGFRAEMSADTARAMSADRRVRYIEQNVPMFRSGSRATTGNPKDGNGNDNGTYEDGTSPWHLARLSHRNRADSLGADYVYETDGTGVRIYVVDNRVFLYHQEFVETGVGAQASEQVKGDASKYPRVQVLNGSDQITPSNLPTEDDPTLPEMHGAAVASLAGGRNVGVASGAEIRPVRAVSGGLDTTAVLVSAFEWILQDTADHHPSVVTISTFRTADDCQGDESARCKVQGLSAGNDGYFLAFEEAVQNVLDNGIPVVASANNNARDACHDTPARLSRRGGFKDLGRLGGLTRLEGGVITVGAFAKEGDWRYVADPAPVTDPPADASNYGPCIDIWAPGEGIASASIPCADLSNPNVSAYKKNEPSRCWQAYRRTDVSGTSYAAPMIAGLIARMFDEDDHLTSLLLDEVQRKTVPERVWQRLHDAATPFERLPNPPAQFHPDPKVGRIVGEDEGLQSKVSDAVTREAVLASSNRLAYMGAFSLEHQPESIQLTQERQTLRAIPVGAPATETVWHIDGVAETLVRTGSDQSLCFAKPPPPNEPVPPENAGCLNPLTNTTYRASVTRNTLTTDSAAATVVVDKPIIKSHPENRWIPNGTSTTLSVEVLAPEGVTPTIRWSTSDGLQQLSGTGTSVTFEPTASRGYVAEVMVNGAAVASSNVAFVRVEGACTPPQYIGFSLNPPLGDIAPDATTFDVIVNAIGPNLEYRWYSGVTGDTANPLKDDKGRDLLAGNPLKLKPGAHQSVWARISHSNGCKFVDTATIDVSGIRRCGTEPTILPSADTLVPRNALRVLSARGASGPFGEAYQWYRVVNGTLQPVPRGDHADINVLVTEEASYRALVRSSTCARLTKPVKLIPVTHETYVGLLDPVTITAFKGHLAEIPNAFKSALPDTSRQDWLIGGTNFGSEVGACPTPCSRVFRTATTSEFLRLRAVHKLGANFLAEDSELIFLNVIPCEDPADGINYFPITAEACPPNDDPQAPPCFRRLVAPASTGGNYKWFASTHLGSGNYANPVVVANGLARVYDVPPLDQSTRFHVEVTNDATCNNVPARSVYLTIAPCTAKRRAIHSPGLPIGGTVTPGTPVLLFLEDEHDGTTFEWFEGNDHNDRSRPVGTGASVTVRPAQTTTYWVLFSRVCDGAPVTANSDFITITVACDTAIVSPPAPAAVRLPPGGGSAQVSTSVIAAGSGELHYQWRDAATNLAIGTDSPAFTWTENVATGSLALYKDVYVDVTVKRGSDPNAPHVCPVRSPTVRLAMVPGTPQTVFGYTPGATLYSASLPEKLRVVMDPPASEPDHQYQYEWYRANGTPAGEMLTWNEGPEILVSTDSIDIFWVKVTGTHRFGQGANDFYTEVSVSKKMYVDLLGTCAMPPLEVTQTLVEDNITSVTFNAYCDWPWVEFEWYSGQSGDTRDRVPAVPGKPDQLTVSTSPSHPYWVRARLECGTVQDSPTLTFTRGSCGPVLINPNIASVEVAYGETAQLHVDPISVARPSYTWYRGAGATHVVPGQDFTPTLTLPNVTSSGRYWVAVGNRDCSNGADSYLATVRVASHPSLMPRTWPPDVWTDYDTGTTLDGTTSGATGYQWYVGEVGDESGIIHGAVSANYVTPGLTTQTKYWVRVFGTGGLMDSPTLTVKICERPRITNTSLLNVNLVSGQAAYLNVTAAGTDLSYQWYRGGERGSPETATPVGRPLSRLLINPSSTTQYWVRVSGRCGVGGTTVWTADSELFNASVCPRFRTTPVSAKTIVMPGTTTTISVDVDRGDTVKWFIGTPGGSATEIPGSGTSITTPVINSPTTFFARATSGNCTIISESVTVDVCSGLSVHWDNQNRKQVEKDQLQLLAAHTGGGAVADFKWYRGNEVGDPTTSTLVHQFSNAYQVHPDVTTSYWVRVTKSETGCHADTPLFTVNVCIPKIVTQPVSQTINPDGSATLTVTSDLPGMQYTWYRGAASDTTNPLTGHTVSDKTSTILVTPATDTTYWVRVTGCNGEGLTPITRDSEAATVTVCQVPFIASQPSNRVATGSTTLTVGATGTELNYQWYRGLSGDTSAPQSSTSASFTVTPTQTTNYWVRVSGRCGTPLNSATATVSVKPAITAQPVGGPIMPGTTRTLTVAATGTELTYAWYERTATGATPIAGATSSSYTTPAITADSTYFCRVTSSAAYTDSNDATLQVCTTPTIHWSGSNPTQVAKGASFFLTAFLGNGQTANFKFYRGNTSGDVANSTLVYQSSSSYQVSSLQSTTSYWVRAWNEGTVCYRDTTVATVNVCIPTILAPPQSVMINPGASTTLRVTTDNLPGVSYQWYSGQPGDTSSPLANQISDTLTVTPPVTTTYWVRVKGCPAPLNPVTSDSQAATVTICQPATITTQPPQRSIRRGTATTLSVGATGTNVQYQWYRATAPSETNPSGATSSISVSPTDPMSYWVKVTSDCAAVNSVTAKVDVCVDPGVTGPASQTIYSGTSATLTVTATAGTSLPLSYQWYSGTSGSGTLISGATAATYATPALTSSASYWVKVTSGVCSTSSATATVSICAYSSTINAPADRDIAVGQTVHFSLTLSPVPDSGRWYRGAQGVTTNPISSYTYADVSPAVTTEYWGEMTHGGCTSKTRTVTVFVSIPTITQQPAASTQVNAGQSATLTVAANTTGLSYQWYSGTSGTGTAIGGATGASYVTPGLAAGSAASYWVKVTGSRGHVVNSDTASVTWCSPAAITSHPTSRSLRRGSSASLTVSATGTNLRYQWYRATSPNEINGIASATTTQLNVVPLDSESYWVKVTSDCGVANSTTARVDICLDPTINTEPASPTINSGSTATLSVAATANTTLGLSYQWYTGTSGNGTAIAGATSSSYTTPALTAAASYWVKVTSGVCSTDSVTAAVSICPYPATLNGPSDRYITRGKQTLLTIPVSPTPQTYKWYRGAQGIRTNLISTSNAYNVYPTVTTQYWGEFTYNGCTTWSRTMTINVCIPTITAPPEPQTIPYATRATLTVTATEATTYQWHLGSTNQPIAGATSATYMTPVLYDDQSYWVRVTGSCGIPVETDYIPVTIAW